MATPSTLSQAELVSKLLAVATAHAGTALTATDSTINGTLTAIKAKWLLGGRKVTSNFRCRLDPANHEVHSQESAMESSWGLPPPTLTIETRSQVGSRVNTTRTDTGVGGEGRSRPADWHRVVILPLKPRVAPHLRVQFHAVHPVMKPPQPSSLSRHRSPSRPCSRPVPASGRHDASGIPALIAFISAASGRAL